MQDLNWLALNPFRAVNLAYRAGAGPLTTDIIVHVDDRLPFRAYAGFDNSGTPGTGRERVFAGFNWGDVLGGDGQLSYQATLSPDVFERRQGRSASFEAHSVTLLQPLPGRARDTLLLFGAVQHAAPVLGDSIGQTGESLQASGRWIGLLRADPARRLQLSLGWDFKQTDNNLLFGGTSVSRQVTQIQQSVAEVDVTRVWSRGVVGGSVSVTASPGGLGGRNSDAAFQPGDGRSGIPFASARYAYLRVTISQTTPLWHRGIEARSRATGQLSTANLLPSEQLSAAGPGSVRGYDPNAVIGSRGFLVSQELWSPSFSPASRAISTQVGAFIEAGAVGNSHRLPDEPSWTRTASAGLSAIWSLGHRLQFRADYAWRLRALPGVNPRALGQISASVGN